MKRAEAGGKWRSPNGQVSVNSQCAICQDTFSPDDDVSVFIPCRHVYHVGCANCLFRSYGRRCACPECRTMVTGDQLLNWSEVQPWLPAVPQYVQRPILQYVPRVVYDVDEEEGGEEEGEFEEEEGELEEEEEGEVEYLGMARSVPARRDVPMTLSQYQRQNRRYIQREGYRGSQSNPIDVDAPVRVVRTRSVMEEDTGGRENVVQSAGGWNEPPVNKNTYKLESIQKRLAVLLHKKDTFMQPLMKAVK